jgi:two-component system, OmpR family, response regulator
MSNSTALPKRSTRKVLIIEDEGEMCLLLNIILDRKDMELDHVKDLEHATEYLKKENPAVVILDNKLPDGFGVDFIDHIKSNYPGVRILMISGYGGSSKEAALANGADVFLEKPFSKDAIYQTLNGLFEAGN